MRKFSLLFLLVMAAVSGRAQWTDDYSTNNRVTPSSVSFYDPVVCTTAEGVTYSFFQVPSTTEAGQDNRRMRLQILDKDGKRLLSAGGKTICNERNISWTKYNQGMIVDKEGNAIIAVYDQRTAKKMLNEKGDSVYGTFNQSIYKFSPTGELLWGPVVLNGGKDDLYMNALYMSALSDNSIVMAYTVSVDDATQKYTIQVEKLNADGTLAWDEPLKLAPEQKVGAQYVVDNGNGTAMIAYFDADNHVWAMAIDGDGNRLFNEPVSLYSGGFSNSRVYESSRATACEDGGMLFVAMDGGYDGRVVYIDAQGNHGFGTTDAGLRVPTVGYGSTVPDVIYDKASQSLYAVYVNLEDNDTYYDYGLSAQRFSATGERLWGEEGLTLVGINHDQQFSLPYVRLCSDGKLALFYQMMASRKYTGSVGSYMTIVDQDGQVQTDTLNFSTSDYTKNNFTVSQHIGGDHFIASWTEKRADASAECIFAQRVKYAPTTEGITAANAEARPIAVSYYDLQGRRIQAPQPGVTIERTEMSDHTILTKKTIIAE